MPYIFSSAKPVEPGWYWYKQYKRSIPRIERVVKHTMSYVNRTGLEMQGVDLFYIKGFWAGPIEEPTDD